MRGIALSGGYAYTLSDQSSTACSQSAGSAQGCELKVWDISTPTSPTYVAGRDVSGSTNGTGSIAGLYIFIANGYAFTTWNASSATCSQSAGSATGCELKVWDLSTPSSPAYVGGGDASGSTNTGSGSAAFRSLFVTDNYLFVAGANSATVCSPSAGSAIGCELKVWQINEPPPPEMPPVIRRSIRLFNSVPMRLIGPRIIFYGNPQ
jgi:hypothetical protein